MAAANIFDTILDLVKTSNLNFQLQQSPFSATISLKKSLVKDKYSRTLFPPVPLSHSNLKIENEDLIAKVLKLENCVHSLRTDYDNSVSYCEQADETIAKLKAKLEEVSKK